MKWKWANRNRQAMSESANPVPSLAPNWLFSKFCQHQIHQKMLSLIRPMLLFALTRLRTSESRRFTTQGLDVWNLEKPTQAFNVLRKCHCDASQQKALLTPRWCGQRVLEPSRLNASSPSPDIQMHARALKICLCQVQQINGGKFFLQLSQVANFQVWCLFCWTVHCFHRALQVSGHFTRFSHWDPWVSSIWCFPHRDQLIGWQT